MKSARRLPPYGWAAVRAGGACRVVTGPIGWRVADRDNDDNHVTLVLPDGASPDDFAWPVAPLLVLDAPGMAGTEIREFARILLESGAEVIWVVGDRPARIVADHSS